MKQYLKNEKQLQVLVEKWTESCKFRADYKNWVESRIWQEKESRRRIAYLETIMGSFKKKRILDLGSGMGGMLTALRQYGYEAMGIDINFDYHLITQLRGRRYKICHQLIQAGGESLPFADQSFDMILCFDVLEHVRHPGRVLREIYRVLKNDGKALLTVVNRFSYIDPHYHLSFVNWIPRFLAEWVIEQKKRQKDYNLFQDNQRLSEMHYYTRGQFRKQCDLSRFKAQDIGWYKIQHPRLIHDKTLRDKITEWNRYQISKPIYALYSFFCQQSWDFLLTKTKGKKLTGENY